MNNHDRDAASGQPLRLHIGGEEQREGWKILNIAPGPNVDYVANCTDLSMFPDCSVSELYASHVYEHLGYVEFIKAISEACRVLVPGGTFRVGLPDLDQLFQIYLRKDLPFKDRAFVTRVIYGGQTNPHDYHKIGLNFEMLQVGLREAGFSQVVRVEKFDLFNDCSCLQYRDIPISLNVIATK